MVDYIQQRLIQIIVSFLPLKLSYWLGLRIAHLEYHLRRESREAIRANLSKVLRCGVGERKIDKLVRKVFENFAKRLVDFYRLDRFNKENIREFVTIKGEEHLRRAFNQGRGVIALSCHLGNWELGGITLAILGYPVNAVVLSHQEKRVNEIFVRQRMKKGVKVIPLGATMRRCYKALKRNEMVAMVGDRDVDFRGLRVPFLGRPTILPRGPATFALQTGALILPAFMVRMENGHFNLFLEEPIQGFSTGDKIKDLRFTMEKVAKVMERYIHRYPEQWFMFHHLWPGEKNEGLRSNSSLQ